MAPISIMWKMWEGSISDTAVKQLGQDKDIRLYQLYGRHPIFGTDSLLYIGQTTDSIEQRIAAHVKSHPDMGKILSDQNRWKDVVGYFSEVYCGRLDLSPNSIAREELKQLIEEKLTKLGKELSKLNKNKNVEDQKKLIEQKKSKLIEKLNRLDGDKGVEKQLIEDAEKLLIYACTPPWNSDNIQTCDLTLEDLRILNFGNCRSLLPEISAEFWI